VTARRGLATALALTALLACRPDDQRTESVDPAALLASLDVAVVAALDSGNAAFRAGDLEGAARHYRRVTESAPETAAGWFGLYMVEQARGNEQAAEAALERARGVAPGASLLRPTTEGGNR
jgi:Flp pilus assembly protein TadD